MKDKQRTPRIRTMARDNFMNMRGFTLSETFLTLFTDILRSQN